VKIIDRTKLSDTATGYRIHIDAEDLNHEETPRERYNRYLNQERRETQYKGGKPETAKDQRRSAAE
jgi:hypothetical protein